MSASFSAYLNATHSLRLSLNACLCEGIFFTSFLDAFQEYYFAFSWYYSFIQIEQLFSVYFSKHGEYEEK